MKWERILKAAPWAKRAMPRGGQMDGYFYIISGRAGPFGLGGRRRHPQVLGRRLDGLEGIGPGVVGEPAAEASDPELRGFGLGGLDDRSTIRARTLERREPDPQIGG